MRTWEKIAFGLVTAGTLGYFGYKMFGPPPVFTVYSYSLLDGSGTFQWGKASGGLGNAGFDAGWGYSGTLSNYVSGTGWTLQITKNGAVYKTIIINGAGPYNL